MGKENSQSKGAEELSRDRWDGGVPRVEEVEARPHATSSDESLNLIVDDDEDTKTTTKKKKATSSGASRALSSEITSERMAANHYVDIVDEDSVADDLGVGLVDMEIRGVAMAQPSLTTTSTKPADNATQPKEKKKEKAPPELTGVVRAEDGGSRAEQGGGGHGMFGSPTSNVSTNVAAGQARAGGKVAMPVPEMVSPSAPPVDPMEPHPRSRGGMPLSSFPIPADATAGGVSAAMGSVSTNEASLTAQRRDPAPLSPHNPATPSEREDIEEQTAISGYIVPERQQHEEGGRPTASAGDAVLMAPQVYDGIPVPPSAAETTEDVEARNRRRHRRIIGTVAVFVLLAAIVAAAVVTSRKKKEESGSTSLEEPERDFSTLNEVLPTMYPTVMPSSAPSSEKFVTMRIMLISALTSRGMTADVLDDPSSPQGQALHWLAYEDEQNVLIPNEGENNMDMDTVNELSIRQRFALATFYFSTGGPDAWVDKYNFLSSQHECNWNAPSDFVSFVYEVHFESLGVFCVEDNVTVDELVIVSNNLTGTLPNEVGLLESLINLIIGKNTGLHGHIPRVLLNMPRLQGLYLIENSLSGPIPEYNSASSPLEYLWLVVNNLNSTIPSSLGQLSNLISLRLDYNSLTGSIPSELSQLSKLEYLGIGSNELTALFDPWPGALPSLKELYAHRNNISILPPSLFTLRNLSTLYVWDNHINGTLPSEIGHLTQLRDLDFSENSFMGTLPPVLWEMTTLEHLSLWWNEFTGTLSSGVGNLTELNYLRLNDNELSVTLPTTIGLLTNLERLDLVNNKFTGQVPDDSIGRMVALKDLQLAWNNLTGDLTSVCDRDLVFSRVDCFVGEDNTSVPEVKCECCTACCHDDRDDGPMWGCFPNN